MWSVEQLDSLGGFSLAFSSLSSSSCFRWCGGLGGGCLSWALNERLVHSNVMSH